MANKKTVQSVYHYDDENVQIDVNKDWDDPVSLLSPEIKNLDKIKSEYENLGASRFSDSNAYVSQAKKILIDSIQKEFNTDINWLFDAIDDVGKKEGSREEKFTQEERRENCAFVKMLINRGSSETQAFKLLSKLRGDLALSEGTLRMLRDDYSAYKKEGIPIEEDINDSSYEDFRQECIECDCGFSKDITEFVHYLDVLGQFRYSPEIYIDETKAYNKTISAFEVLCEEIVRLILPEDINFPDVEDRFRADANFEKHFKEWCLAEGTYIERILNNPVYAKTHKNIMVEELIGEFIHPFVTLP